MTNRPIPRIMVCLTHIHSCMLFAWTAKNDKMKKEYSFWGSSSVWKRFTWILTNWWDWWWVVSKYPTGGIIILILHLADIKTATKDGSLPYTQLIFAFFRQQKVMHCLSEQSTLKMWSVELMMVGPTWIVLVGCILNL